MPREIAFWDNPGDNWSGYWYERTGTGPLNVFGTHGVEDPASSMGFQAFLANVSASRIGLNHLNPQVQEQFIATNPTATATARTARATRRHVRSTKRNAGRVNPTKVARRLAP
jgi:hypothetical protein